jgi:hypothetical protein
MPRSPIESGQRRCLRHQPRQTPSADAEGQRPTTARRDEAEEAGARRLGRRGPERARHAGEDLPSRPPQDEVEKRGR